MRIDEPAQRERLPEFAALSREHASGWNRIPGIKLFIDGVVEGKTAMLFAPYADGSGETGVPNWDPEIYAAIVCEADRLGMQVTTHAIGDRAVHTTLNAYEEAARQNGGDRDLRHRVEHIEVSRPDDMPRFVALKVTASMQPLHAVPTTDPEHTAFTRLVGPERLPYAFRWRSLLETGARVSFGSDWPIVTPDPFKGLHAAVTRTSAVGLPRGGYQPQECVTLAQALDAYTIGAARAEKQEQIKGQLRPGMLADITVFSQDLFAQGTAAILDTKVVLTVLDGRIVYRTEQV
jgi:predicted amidohydrolase YtcJ